MSSLRPILADQLTRALASLKDIILKEDIIVLCEVRAETDYAPHHRQKIWYLFSAMRHFSKKLTDMGYHVHYVTLDDPLNTQDLVKEWERLASFYSCSKVVLTEPGEWRLKKAILSWQESSSLKIDCREDTRFLSTHAEFSKWAKGKKQLRMEYFYQMMRKKYSILLNERGEPEGGKWNYDVENREPLKNIPQIPARVNHPLDEMTLHVRELVLNTFPNYFGDMDSLNYAVTSEEATNDVEHFFKTCLPYFGQYQDNMLAKEPYLFHGVLSMYLNIGFFNPLDLCKRAEELYRKGCVPLAAAEGFIRQILGWREYIRGMYWHFMPEYKERNFFNAHRPLPDLYWGGKTQMNCMAGVVQHTKKYAYSHHIQRLMITGNFALLAELDPRAVCDWYLGVYIDAYEWVELPNTLGMALFADGGLVASKPYAASSRYIHAMSDYCKSCEYNTKLVIGEKACPFNSLYWHFVAKNEAKLSANLRMKYIYATWNRFTSEKQTQIIEQAKYYLDLLSLNKL